MKIFNFLCDLISVIFKVLSVLLVLWMVVSVFEIGFNYGTKWDNNFFNLLMKIF